MSQFRVSTDVIWHFFLLSESREATILRLGRTRRRARTIAPYFFGRDRNLGIAVIIIIAKESRRWRGCRSCCWRRAPRCCFPEVGPCQPRAPSPDLPNPPRTAVLKRRAASTPPRLIPAANLERRSDPCRGSPAGVDGCSPGTCPDGSFCDLVGGAIAAGVCESCPSAVAGCTSSAFTSHDDCVSRCFGALAGDPAAAPTVNSQSYGSGLENSSDASAVVTEVRSCRHLQRFGRGCLPPMTGDWGVGKDKIRQLVGKNMPVRAKVSDSRSLRSLSHLLVGWHEHARVCEGLGEQVTAVVGSPLGRLLELPRWHGRCASSARLLHSCTPPATRSELFRPFREGRFPLQTT